MTAPTLCPRIVPTIGNGAVLPTHKNPLRRPPPLATNLAGFPHRLLSRVTLKASPL
jgi:hypothetical protein